MIKLVTRYVNYNHRLNQRISRNTDKAFRYIGGAIRRNARSSIRKGTKSKPHSTPGNAVHSRTGIFTTRSTANTTHAQSG